MKLYEKIKKNNKTFIIAEISANHKQKFSNIIKLINQAVLAGVDAIKLQTYTPDTITLKSNKKDFRILDKNNNLNQRNLYDVFSEAHTPWKWQKKVFSYAKKKGLVCFSSVFDETSVDFLSKIGVNAYKISSFEINHHPLLKKVAREKKVVFLSTGMASSKEIFQAIKILKKNGTSKIILLKCTSHYPADPKDVNLNTIIEMRKKFKCIIGISDHTVGTSVPLASVALGAKVIEKHFKLPNDKQSLDSHFSIDFKEMKYLVNQCKIVKSSIGSVVFGPTKKELKNIKYRRSIYYSKDIRKGEKISKKNIKVIRPSLGLHPKYFDIILGKKLKKNVNYATRVKLTDFQ
jgi:pseudaminic acid synthase